MMMSRKMRWLALIGVVLSCIDSSVCVVFAEDGFQKIRSNRMFPSIFMAWSVGASSKEPSLAEIARHDLMILGPAQMGLGRVIPGTWFDNLILQNALGRRSALMQLNPNAVLLAEVRYFNAWDGYLPPDSHLWSRDEFGKRVLSGDLSYGTDRYYRLEFTNPELQDSVALQCKAYVSSGVFDGCMFDYWADNSDLEGQARLTMIEKVRAAVGDKALLIGNVTGLLPKLTASYLNGVYMEGFGASFFSNWHRAADNLTWLEANLRPPAFTALEGWYDCGVCTGDPAAIQARGRGDLAFMREVTTLSLTNSDGYVLFGDPNRLPTPDHLHNWYPFWDKTLGRPVGPKHIRSADGGFRRAFDNGCAVFNPPDNRPVTVTFRVPHRSEATGTVALAHTVNQGDGDIFLLVDAGDPSQNGEHDACLSAGAQ